MIQLKAVLSSPCRCEKRSDEAIQRGWIATPAFGRLAMTHRSEIGIL